MGSHAALVDRWRSRLAEAERQIAHVPLHRRWLPEVYARVYRFLLSCYGNDTWQEDATADGLTSGMAFHDTTRDDTGASPKSSESIRATLGAIHEVCGDQPAPGPMATRGLHDDDWIAVASESSLVSPAKCVKLLRQHGLQADPIRRGDDTIVVVPAGQRERAFSLLRDNRDTLRAPWRRGRRMRFACLTALAVLALGVPSVVLCGILLNRVCGVWVNSPSLTDRSILVAAVAVVVAWVCGLLSALLSWRR